MARVSDVIDVDPNAAPVTTLPDHAGGVGQSRDALRAAAMVEGVAAAGEEAVVERDEDAIAEDLSQQEEEPTAEQLRALAGADAKGLTDEQLVAEYEKAKAAEEFKLPFPVYDAEGNKITDVSKLSLKDVLSGKVQIGYNAMGKEQRKALHDILRVAANGHLNESKIATTLAERNQVHAQLQDLKKQHESWADDRKTWDKVLNAAARGNVEPLQRLIQAYVAGSDAPPVVDEAASAQDAQLDTAGQQYILNTIIPAAYKTAAEYGADPTEVTNAIIGLIQNEPVEFLTQAKIESILNHEIQAELERVGYSRGAAAPVTAPAQDALLQKLESMEKQLLELKAGKVNAGVAAVRRRAPPAGSGSVTSAGEAMPAMKSREDMKKWLRGETDA